MSLHLKQIITIQLRVILCFRSESAVGISDGKSVTNKSQFNNGLATKSHEMFGCTEKWNSCLNIRGKNLLPQRLEGAFLADLTCCILEASMHGYRSFKRCTCWNLKFYVSLLGKSHQRIQIYLH